MGYGITVLVRGKRACFTRPEFKAERVSYDMITPSAARGILEAVYWKPAIVWKIDAITVLNKIRFATFRRNEVESKVSYYNAKQVALACAEKELALIATELRQQRATMYLEDVAYTISAHFEMTENASDSETPEKHYNIALRRLRQGQCFNQPYFGCREFPVEEIRLLETGEVAPISYYVDEEARDLSYMLYDVDYEHGMEPIFFRAVLRRGVLDVAAAREAMSR